MMSPCNYPFHNYSYYHPSSAYLSFSPSFLPLRHRKIRGCRVFTRFSPIFILFYPFLFILFYLFIFGAKTCWSKLSARISFCRQMWHFHLSSFLERMIFPSCFWGTLELFNDQGEDSKESAHEGEDSQESAQRRRRLARVQEKILRRVQVKKIRTDSKSKLCKEFQRSLTLTLSVRQQELKTQRKSRITLLN
uniref:Transmembrane protein n=1 Tax=Caenorhabditis japonica TaxID=281687 RepID=A0A8R1E9R6_CAEJA